MSTVIPSLLNFQIRITESDLAQQKKITTQKALKQVQVKGFRKGMAPLQMAQKQLDQEKILQQSIAAVLPSRLEALLLEEKQKSGRNHVILVEDPSFELVDNPTDSDFVINTKVVLYPEVDIADVENLTFKKSTPKLVTDADIGEFIDNLRNNYAKTKTHGAGTVSEESIISDEELAKIFELQTYSELQERVRTELEGSNQYAAEREQEESITHSLVDHYQDRIDIPESMVVSEVKRINDSIVAQLQKLGASFEQYLESRNKSREEVKEDVLVEAKRNIVLMIVLTELVKAWNIQLDEREEQQINSSQQSQQDTLRLMLKQRKVLDRLKNQIQN